MTGSKAKNVLKAAPLQFIVHNAKGLVDTKQGWALSPVCLPSVYLIVGCIWPNLPGLPPPYLHTASDRRLEVGMAGERSGNEA